MTLNNPQSSRFDIKLAQKLLLLIEQAYYEFEQSQHEPSWNWDEDINSIKLKAISEEYEIKVRFGFAEYFYFMYDQILKLDIKKLGEIGRDRVPLGFVAYNETNNETYIVFRGTTTAAEWITNLQFKPGYEPFLGKNELGNVHRGFYKIYSRKDPGANIISQADDLPAIKECLEAVIYGCSAKSIGQWPKKAIKECPRDSQVYVTGHSLGGALATLATLHIKELNYFNKPPILYTFASPRVGGPIFAEILNKLKCFRIANSEDLVPTVPLASVRLKEGSSEDISSKSLPEALLPLASSILPDLDYQHVGEPIYFTLHKASIVDNHTIPVYKEALGII